MTYFSSRTPGPRPISAALLGLGLACSACPARAVTIQAFRTHHGPNISGDEARDIRTFLAGGPSHWAVAKPPKLPAGLTITGPDGSLKSGAMVNFLAWRRDLNPQFFDYRHPRIAPLFRQQDRALASRQAQLLAATIALPPHSSGFMTLDPVKAAVDAKNAHGPANVPVRVAQVIAGPAPVPEPSGVVSTLAIFGLAGGWWRLRRGRPGAPA